MSRPIIPNKDRGGPPNPRPSAPPRPEARTPSRPTAPIQTPKPSRS